MSQPRQPLALATTTKRAREDDSNDRDKDKDKDKENLDYGTQKLLLQLSALATARAVMPPTSSAVEFELMMRSPTVFPWLDHTQPAIMDAFVRSLSPRRRTPSALLPLAHSARQAAPRDPRLARLRLSQWLPVALPHGLAAALMAHFLDNNHLTLGFFDADLFLDDLAAGRNGDFCSPLLVAALLYLANLQYTSTDLSTVPLTTVLLNEALRLWRDTAQDPDSLATVAALGVLSTGLICTGQGVLALEAAADAREMAVRLGLLGAGPLAAPAGSSSSLEEQEAPDTGWQRQRWLRAASHVAWGGHNWYTILAHFYHEMPVIYPPALPLPGLHSRYTVHTFPLLCKLWALAHEVALVYLPDKMRGTLAPLAFAEAKYHKLLAWLEAVNRVESQSIQRGEGLPSYIMVFHMMIHVVIGKIWHPFLNSPHQLRSLKSYDATPRAIYAASVRQLQDLILRYRAGYPDVLFTSSASAALVMLVGALLREVPRPPTWAATGPVTTSVAAMRRTTMGTPPSSSSSSSIPSSRSQSSHGLHLLQLQKQQHRQRKQEEKQRQKQYEQAIIIWRSYFLLCMRCWQDMYTCYPIFRDVVRAHLAQALQQNAVSPTEARNHVAELDRRGAHHYYHQQDQQSLQRHGSTRSQQEEEGDFPLRKRDEELHRQGEALRGTARGSAEVGTRSTTLGATVPATRAARVADTSIASATPDVLSAIPTSDTGVTSTTGELSQGREHVELVEGPRLQRVHEAEHAARGGAVERQRGADGFSSDTDDNNDDDNGGAASNTEGGNPTALPNTTPAITTTKTTTTGTFVSEFEESGASQDGRVGGRWMPAMAAKLDDLTLFAEFTTNDDLEVSSNDMGHERGRQM